MKTFISGMILIFAVTTSCDTRSTATVDQVQDTLTSQAVDSLSGLVIAENFELVRAQCTACHSAKLITQNSASREGWEQMIRWMQKDQGLPDLGVNEDIILDYLATHYGIKKKGRRSSLTEIEWYVLEPQ